MSATQDSEAELDYDATIDLAEVLHVPTAIAIHGCRSVLLINPAENAWPALWYDYMVWLGICQHMWIASLPS